MGHVTTFSWMVTIMRCLVVLLGLGLDFSVWLVGGYAHVFVLYM